MFAGHPIECLPSMASFPNSWVQYAENYCWSQDTYFLPPNVHVAQIRQEDRYSPERKLSYYQWVPFFLLMQAACFRAPSLLWKILSINQGIRVHDIVKRATDPSNMEENSRAKNMDVLTKHISHALRFQDRVSRKQLLLHKTLKFLNVTYSACFISFMYLVTKALYLVNVLAQLYLMNKFLETDKHHWYGLGVIRDLVNGVAWESSGYFPRVSLCDFEVRQVANIQKYSIQCVLVINIFNEKIFILLWFWYTFLLLATIASFFYWLMLTAFPCFGWSFVKEALEVNDVMQVDIKKNKKEVRQFVTDYLKQDGIFVLRMVQLHAGILFGTELVIRLYETYLDVVHKGKYENKPLVVQHSLENNINESLRRRKKGSDAKLDLTDVVTQLLPMVHDDDSSSSSSSSSDSSPPQQDDKKHDDDDNKIKEDV
ncbi:INX-11 protein [Aphelenchoides avenae]|nr:INX-11 protein [Aphelenchus avenae]